MTDLRMITTDAEFTEWAKELANNAFEEVKNPEQDACFTDLASEEVDNAINCLYYSQVYSIIGAVNMADDRAVNLDGGWQEALANDAFASGDKGESFVSAMQCVIFHELYNRVMDEVSNLDPDGEYN